MLRTYAGAGLPSYLIAAHVLSMVFKIYRPNPQGLACPQSGNHA